MSFCLWTASGAMNSRAFRLMLAIVFSFTIWSAIAPVDYATWFFELFIGMICVVILVYTRRQFQFSEFFYYVVAVHYIVLACGAKYTYADMPLFNWMRDVFALSRNHFDRVGHFMQGLTQALLTRELLVRTESVRNRKLLAILSASVAVAFSGMYEVLEWLWISVFYPTQGVEWLGMQGDPWDAQGDILAAFLGACVAVTILGVVHDRSIKRTRDSRLKH